MKRMFGLLVGLVATLGFGAASVSAVYPDNPPTVVVDSSTPTVGSNVTLTFDSFCPGDTITISIGGNVLGSVVADANGEATFTFPAPSPAGTYVITATGTDCPDTVASLTIAVRAPGSIPVTGSGSTSSGLELGAFAVVAGVGMVGIAGIRRRRPAVA